MKKEELRREMTALLEESKALQESSALELKTAQFLSNEANRLFSLMDAENVPFDIQEGYVKQLEALATKIEYEKRQLPKDKIRLEYIQDRLKVLKMLCEQGLVE
jgi:hypothetical protein